MKFICTYSDGVKSFAPFDRGAEDFAEKMPLGRLVYLDYVPDNKIRSKEQNALAWAWYAEIAEHQGEIVTWAHDHSKLEIGVPILQRDSEKFCQIWEQVTAGLDYLGRMQLIHHWPITRVFTPKQMTEYLNSMVVYWAKQGIVLKGKNEKH